MKLVIEIDLEAVMPNGSPACHPKQIAILLLNAAVSIGRIASDDLRTTQGNPDPEDQSFMQQTYAADKDQPPFGHSYVTDEPFELFVLPEERVATSNMYNAGAPE